jgi:predicted ArsR family transcriptional regulator
MVKMVVSRDIKELELLEALADKPEARQVDLAARLGVAVGTVNWHLKRFAAKGYIKVKRMGRWHWGYILTPQGVVEKARLTMSYVHSSMSLYRDIREQCRSLLQQVAKAGYQEVVLEGEGDLVDVCKLTCLEQGIYCIASNIRKQEVPVLTVDGLALVLELPDEDAKQRSGARGSV